MACESRLLMLGLLEMQSISLMLNLLEQKKHSIFLFELFIHLKWVIIHLRSPPVYVFCIC